VGEMISVGADSVHYDISRPWLRVFEESSLGLEAQGWRSRTLDDEGDMLY
jgi:hypothetical protein